MKSKRMAIDTAMILVLPLLMAYSLIGERFHEIAGTLMLILFLTHHSLNSAWRRNLSKGRYSLHRICRTTLNAVLLIFMILQPLCGILISKHIYTFLPTGGLSSLAREIHLPLAHWGFVLMCLHTGVHLRPFIKRLPLWGKAVGAVIAAYGVYAFVKRQFPAYMFLKTGFAFFDYSEPALLFVLDVLAMMVLFAALGWWIDGVLTSRAERRKAE